MTLKKSPTMTLIAATAAALVLAACAGKYGSSSGGGSDAYATTAGSGGGGGMSFFVTGSTPGKGADLGGLAGADAQCQSLASAVGAGGKTWRAYLSAAAKDGQPAVNARDRIGKGPWRNVKGEVVAKDVDDLHSANNKLGKQTSLTEKGAVVNGSGDTPNEHDILTGSSADGRLDTSAADTTCRNWTSSSDGAAMMGHLDRTGTNPDPVKNVSWNASHLSRGGCSQDALKSTGSAGRFYCFAVN
jgi:hypothetical protein